MRSSVGTANSGVPKKITRMVAPQKRRRKRLLYKAAERSFPFACFLQLFDFAFDQGALEGAQVIDEQDAVKMIDLMQHGAGEKVFAADFERFASDFSCADGGLFGATHRLAEARNAEASFFSGLLAVAGDPLGVDQNDPFRLVAFFGRGHVDYRKPFPYIDL